MYHLNGEILHPFPGFVAVSGYFPSAAAVSPGFEALSGTFSLLGGIFSRFYPQNKDVSPPPPHFLPELWRFSGHFLSAAAVSPRFVAFFRTFFFARSFPPHFGGEMRMFCCWERFSPRFVAFSGTFFFAR